jgi:hypothetical protein
MIFLLCMKQYIFLKVKKIMIGTWSRDSKGISSTTNNEIVFFRFELNKEK